MTKIQAQLLTRHTVTQPYLDGVIILGRKRKYWTSGAIWFTRRACTFANIHTAYEFFVSFLLCKEQFSVVSGCAWERWKGWISRKRWSKGLLVTKNLRILKEIIEAWNWTILKELTVPEKVVLFGSCWNYITNTLSCLFQSGFQILQESEIFPSQWKRDVFIKFSMACIHFDAMHSQGCKTARLKICSWFSIVVRAILEPAVFLVVMEEKAILWVINTQIRLFPLFFFALRILYVVVALQLLFQKKKSQVFQTVQEQHINLTLPVCTKLSSNQSFTNYLAWYCFYFNIK